MKSKREWGSYTLFFMLALTSVASTHHIMYMHIIRKATTTLSIMIMTATVMPTADELPGSDDPSNSTITGDEKLPAPTEVTAWICEYEEGAIPDNKLMNALQCRTLGAMRARILKSACATEMRVMESIRKICEQKTETKEKEARCLILSRISGSV